MTYCINFKLTGILAVTTLTLLFSGCTHVRTDDQIVDSNHEDNVIVNENDELPEGSYELKKESYLSVLKDVEKSLRNIEGKQSSLETIQSVQAADLSYIYIGFADDEFVITPDTQIPEGYQPTKRPWYTGALEQEYYADEYLDAMTEAVIYTVSTKLTTEQFGEAVIGIDFILESDPEKADVYMMEKLEEDEMSLEEIIDFTSEPVDFITGDAFEMWESRINQIDKDLSDLDDRESIEEILAKQLNAYENVTTVFLASPKGDFYLSEDVELPSDYDPTQRPWYQETLNGNGLYKSEPYRDIISGKTIVSLFMELKNTSEIGWVLGIDITQ